MKIYENLRGFLFFGTQFGDNFVWQLEQIFSLHLALRRDVQHTHARAHTRTHTHQAPTHKLVHVPFIAVAEAHAVFAFWYRKWLVHTRHKIYPNMDACIREKSIHTQICEYVCMSACENNRTFHNIEYSWSGVCVCVCVCVCVLLRDSS
jgi:hypothetical protein